MRILFLLLCVITCYLGWGQKDFISHDSIRIVYDDEGEGKVVLLIHGFINTRKSWSASKLKEDLIQKGYRVIVPDLRGNGASDKPHSTQFWEKNNEVKDLIALIDHENIHSYSVVAYSRGVTVASELSLHDKRITKMVLGGMGDEFTDPEWAIPTIFALAFSSKAELTEMTIGAVTYAKSIGADMICLSMQQKYQPSPSVDALKKLNLPVLIIVGDEDNAYSKTTSLSTIFSYSQTKIVDGDHNNTYKQANFSKAILSFLE